MYVVCLRDRYKLKNFHSIKWIISLVCMLSTQSILSHRDLVTSI